MVRVGERVPFAAQPLEALKGALKEGERVTLAEGVEPGGGLDEGVALDNQVFVDIGEADGVSVPALVGDVEGEVEAVKVAFVLTVLVDEGVKGGEGEAEGVPVPLPPLAVSVGTGERVLVKEAVGDGEGVTVCLEKASLGVGRGLGESAGEGDDVGESESVLDCMGLAVPPPSFSSAETVAGALSVAELVPATLREGGAQGVGVEDTQAVRVGDGDCVGE